MGRPACRKTAFVDKELYLRSFYPFWVHERSEHGSRDSDDCSSKTASNLTKYKKIAVLKSLLFRECAFHKSA